MKTYEGINHSVGPLIKKPPVGARAASPAQFYETAMAYSTPGLRSFSSSETKRLIVRNMCM